MTQVLPDDLDRLLRAVEAGREDQVGLVRLRPDDGEPNDDWLTDLDRARAAADAGALRHRRRVDEAAERLFGKALSDLLPPVPGLRRWDFTVPVPRRAQLSDLVPALRDRAPAGPPPPFPERVADRVTVRVTAPARPEAAVVRLHGGAFWMGGGPVSAAIDAALIGQVAVAAHAAVLDVDYRLAPEHPYPAAIVDALSVLDAARAGAAGTPFTRLALLGTSSGANTAALAARVDSLREGGTPMAALALVAPSMLLHDAPSPLREDPGAWRNRMAQLRGYLGDHIDPADPWVSPGTASSIPDMPPTFLAVAAFDEVAIGGDELAAAIRAGGGEVTSRRYDMTHVVATPRVEAAVVADVAGFLRSRLS